MEISIDKILVDEILESDISPPQMTKKKKKKKKKQKQHL